MQNKLIERLKATPLYPFWGAAITAKMVISLDKMLRQRGVRFIFALPPDAARLNSLTDFEKERIQSWTFDFNHITEHDAQIISRLYGDESVEIMLEKYDGAKVIIKNGHKTLADFSNRYVNIVGGRRITPNQPEEYYNTIYFYGACTVRGTGVGDDETIPSYTQACINEKYPGTFRCVNQAIGCGSSVADDIYRINNTVLYKGDIVVICNLVHNFAVKLMKKSGVEVWDCSEAFHTKPRGGEWFTDEPFHTNKVGNHSIAVYFFRKLEENSYLGQPSGKRELIGCLRPDENVDETWIQSKEFKSYISYLETQKTDGTNNGAIVMNCNPFTLGHRYLIETAAQNVTDLFIFVVEEDKSFFPFRDRIDLVTRGTADLKNVHVLPSGKFIISALTFPGYFYKDENKDAIVDTSQDIELFARYIAPVLNIRVRFAGEEPLDPVTRQYNETMAEYLPMYGIEFREIRRKSDEENVISASRVRAAIQEKDWELVDSLVPQVTREYLLKRFR